MWLVRKETQMYPQYMPINTKVFLDANIVIRTGKPPGGPEFERIVDLVDAEIISILSTDLTIAEVAKKTHW